MIKNQVKHKQDHVHLLVQIPPTIELAKLVKILKGRTSREIRKRYWLHVRGFLWGKNLWSPSYCAVSCGGVTIDTIRNYIENQDQPP